jgi:HTH-type transcriptional regulator / antitoxin HipB
MNKKHIGSSVLDHIKEMEKDPVFKKAFDEHIEKARIAMLFKEIRAKENLTQSELAKKAHIAQSVIARIETGSSKTLPRLDLFNKILSAIGYETSIVVKKKGKTICMALS